MHPSYTDDMKQRLLVYTIIGFVIGLIIGGLSGYFIGASQSKKDSIDSYEACVNAGYPVQESYPPRCAVPGGKTFTQEVSVTFEGTVVCLPHKNMDGPHTLECATGLKADDGKYYGLASSDTTLSEVAGSEKRVRITGTLSANADDKYQSEAMVNVTRFESLQE